jgi:hypothetical protein
MFGNLVNLLVWLLLAAWIVVSGWDKPLKYYFMSEERVRAEEAVFVPTPVPAPDYRNWNRPAQSGGALGHSPIGGNGPKGPSKH